MFTERLDAAAGKLRRRLSRMAVRAARPIGRSVVEVLEEKNSGKSAFQSGGGEPKFCPICGILGAKWGPGPNGRPDAACNPCKGLERHRIMWLAIYEHTRLLEQPGRVLHVAPESFLAQRLKSLPGVQHTSVDLLREDVDVQADLCDLPFEDASFDHIVCSHVLEHIPDDRAAMREMCRVLRKGGRAIINVPLKWDRKTEEDPEAPVEERIRRFGQADHIRYYGADIQDRLREAGFEVAVSCPGKELPQSLVRLMRIHDEPIFFASPAA